MNLKYNEGISVVELVWLPRLSKPIGCYVVSVGWLITRILSFNLFARKMENIGGVVKQIFSIWSTDFILTKKEYVQFVNKNKSQGIK